VRGNIIDVVHTTHPTNTFPHSPLLPFDIRDVEIDKLFDLGILMDELNAMWPTEEDKVTATRLLRTILADGCNPGAGEIILQEEARHGIPDWRLAELLHTYDQWNTIQSKAADYDHYEYKLNAQALLAYSAVIKNRHLITTETWRLGIAGSSVEAGDLVCILHGSRTPVILRAQDDGCRVIGQAYVEGLMRGEAVNWLQDEANIFELV
jgi:hypothetical protein